MRPLAETHTGDSLDRLGPTAIVSYLNVGVFTLTAIGVFAMIMSGTEITAVWAGIIGAILGSTGGGLATTNQFWLGGNVGTKATTSALTKLAVSPGQTTATAPAATTQVINTGGPDPSLDIPEPPK